jgi:hypothetical protein
MDLPSTDAVTFTRMLAVFSYFRVFSYRIWLNSVSVLQIFIGPNEIDSVINSACLIREVG